MSDLNLSDVQIQSQDPLFVVCFPLVLSAWGGGSLLFHCLPSSSSWAKLSIVVNQELTETYS